MPQTLPCEGRRGSGSALAITQRTPGILGRFPANRLSLGPPRSCSPPLCGWAWDLIRRFWHGPEFVSTEPWLLCDTATVSEVPHVTKMWGRKQGLPCISALSLHVIFTGCSGH